VSASLGFELTLTIARGISSLVTLEMKPESDADVCGAGVNPGPAYSSNRETLKRIRPRGTRLVAEA
jgi:hypothetical protein